MFYGNIYASQSEFSVSTEKNEYTDPNINNYYSIKLLPTQDTTLKLKIINQSQHKNTFNIKVLSSKSKSDMTISYFHIASEKLNNNYVSVNNLVKSKTDRITINPKSEKEVNIYVKMPEKYYTGKILGGINIVREPRTTERRSNGLTPQFAYLIPIVLRQNDESVSPTIKFGSANVVSHNSKNYLSLHIDNLDFNIINNVDVKMKLYDQNGKIIFKNKSSRHSIAPKSTFDYTIPLNKTVLSKGKYTYSISLIDKNGHSWSAKRIIDIKENKARKIEKNVNHTSNILNKYLIIAAAILIFVLIVFVKIFRKK